MKHSKAYKVLSRDNAHRLSMLRNLSKALFSNLLITTTQAKCQMLRSFVSKIMTRMLKQDTEPRAMRYARKALALASPRDAASVLQFYQAYRNHRQPNYIRHKRLYIQQNSTVVFCVSLIPY